MLSQALNMILKHVSTWLFNVIYTSLYKKANKGANYIAVM